MHRELSRSCNSGRVLGTKGAAPSYGVPGGRFGEGSARRGRMMTVPLDTRNDIRSLDAEGVSRSDIARRLHLSRNTVAKYADMEDMSPAPPLPAERPR